MFYSDRICTDSGYDVHVICTGLVIGSTGACEDGTPLYAINPRNPFPNNVKYVNIGVCRNARTNQIMKCVSAASDGGKILLYSWENGRCASYDTKTIP